MATKLKVVIFILSMFWPLLVNARASTISSKCTSAFQNSDMSPYATFVKRPVSQEDLKKLSNSLKSSMYSVLFFDVSKYLANNYLLVQCESKDSKISISNFDDNIAQTSRAFLYQTLAQKLPTTFYQALFFRRNFIHPQANLYFEQERQNFQDLVQSVSAKKLKYLWSSYYYGFYDRYLKDTDIDSSAKDLVCSRLQASRLRLPNKDAIYLRTFEKRYLTLPEVLVDVETEDSAMFAKFYYETLCQNRAYSICLQPDGHFRAAEHCNKDRDVFGIVVGRDSKAETYLHNTKDLLKTEQKLVKWLYTQPRSATLHLFDVDIDKKRIDLAFLDLDALFFYEKTWNRVYQFGLSKEEALAETIGEYRSGYSKSYTLKVTHGNFSYHRGNIFQMSPVRTVKENSCLGRAVNAFVLSSVFYTPTLTYVLYQTKQFNGFNSMGHAWVTFQTSDKKCLTIDNGVLMACDRVLDQEWAAEKIFLDLRENPTATLLREVQINLDDLTLAPAIREIYQQFFSSIISNALLNK